MAYACQVTGQPQHSIIIMQYIYKESIQVLDIVLRSLRTNDIKTYLITIFIVRVYCIGSD